MYIFYSNDFKIRAFRPDVSCDLPSSRGPQCLRMNGSRAELVATDSERLTVKTSSRKNSSKTKRMTTSLYVRLGRHLEATPPTARSHALQRSKLHAAWLVTGDPCIIFVITKKKKNFKLKKKINIFFNSISPLDQCPTV